MLKQRSQSAATLFHVGVYAEDGKTQCIDGVVGTGWWSKVQLGSHRKGRLPLASHDEQRDQGGGERHGA
jgi:hypothetical protein